MPLPTNIYILILLLIVVLIYSACAVYGAVCFIKKLVDRFFGKDDFIE